jgi:excisionase family DNA binding protein
VVSTKTKKQAGRQIDDPFFDFAEAAEYLGQSVRWVKGQHGEGNLPSTKMGRLVRFRKSHLDRYIETHTVAPDGE